VRPLALSIALCLGSDGVTGAAAVSSQQPPTSMMVNPACADVWDEILLDWDPAWKVSALEPRPQDERLPDPAVLAAFLGSVPGLEKAVAKLDAADRDVLYVRLHTLTLADLGKHYPALGPRLLRAAKLQACRQTLAESPESRSERQIHAHAAEATHRGARPGSPGPGSCSTRWSIPRLPTWTRSARSFNRLAPWRNRSSTNTPVILKHRYSSRAASPACPSSPRRAGMLTRSWRKQRRRWGKSARISAVVGPSARLASTVFSVTRVPFRTGSPPTIYRSRS
jgi:hypothetical protein